MLFVLYTTITMTYPLHFIEFSWLRITASCLKTNIRENYLRNYLEDKEDPQTFILKKKFPSERQNLF